MASFHESLCEFESCLSSVLLKLERDGFKFVLKEEQEKAVKSLCFGQDVVGVLPTGFGKSLIFQLLVLVATEKHRVQGFENRNATVLVICPLRSLIEDQLAEVRDLGIAASSLPEASVEDIKMGKFQIVYSSPEYALEQKFLSCIKDGEFHSNLAAVVIDESHTLETWTGKRKSGNAGEKTKVFRKAFAELAMLRSFCKEGTPFLALTGTADKDTLKVIEKDLCLKDAVCLFVSPERKNLRFTVKGVKQSEMFDQLAWLIEMIKETSIDCPKTLIFCNTLNDIAAVFNYLMFKLGPYAYHPPESQKPESRIIGIYHSNTFKKQKERLFKQLKGQGNKRVVVTSSALSMGVNFPDIKYVINWGPARNLLDQLQEAGRAGRDGQQAHVIIVYHGKQLSHCSKDIKKFVKTDGCYRVAAYLPFDSSVQPADIKHNCCNYCSKSCICLEDGCMVSFDFDNDNSEPSRKESELVRPVAEQDKKDLQDALHEVLADIMIGKAAVFDTVAAHGFSSELIDDIVENSHKIFTVKDIVSSFPIFNASHAYRILEVVNEIFMDVPEENLEQTSCLNANMEHLDFLPFANMLDNFFDSIGFSDSEAD